MESIEGELHSISKEQVNKMAKEEEAMEKEEEQPRAYKQTIRELSRLVFKINQPGISEFQIKDLNDKINALIRGKGAEHGFVEKKGKLRGGLRYDNQGAEIPGLKGYKYFGQAKDLPGVKELLAENQQEYKVLDKKSKFELYKNIDVEYFGYFDETEEILKLEQERSEQMRQSLMETCIDEDFSNLENDLVDASQIPDQQQIEQILLERKKKEILSMF